MSVVLETPKVSRALGILPILLFAGLAAAQTDYHLSQDPNRVLYASSAFAHGHRHGYEDGFHAGDEDYQLRRPAAFPQKLPKGKAYKKEFGDRKAYLRGYETGFKAGYADSYSGRSFRLWSAQEIKTANPVHEFDQGIAAGYEAGFTNSASIADEPGLIESASWRCKQEPHTEAFCKGFGPGYARGRADNEAIAAFTKSSTTMMAKNSR